MSVIPADASSAGFAGVIGCACPMSSGWPSTIVAGSVTERSRCALPLPLKERPRDMSREVRLLPGAPVQEPSIAPIIATLQELQLGKPGLQSITIM